MLNTPSLSPFAAAKTDRLAALQQDIARIVPPSRRSETRLPLGCEAADACLKGGLVQGGMHEVAAADYRAQPAALGFLLALCNRALAVRAGILLWPLAKQAGWDFGLPYGPGLRFFGIDPDLLLLARCGSENETLWAMEEGLRLGGLSVVLGARTANMSLTASRRLKLAAEDTQTPIFLLRRHDDLMPSAALTRWRVAPAPSGVDRFGFYETAGWHVTLELAQGGRPGKWMMEWDHDALCLRVSSLLGDRTRPARHVSVF